MRAQPLDVAEIVAEYRLTRAECLKYLLVLDRMGLIELLPGDRIRPRVARDFDWSPDGPIRRYFMEHALDDFLDSDFSKAEETLEFAQGLVTEVGTGAAAPGAAGVCAHAWRRCTRSRWRPRSRSAGGLVWCWRCVAGSRKASSGCGGTRQSRLRAAASVRRWVLERCPLAGRSGQACWWLLSGHATTAGGHAHPEAELSLPQQRVLRAGELPLPDQSGWDFSRIENHVNAFVEFSGLRPSRGRRKIVGSNDKCKSTHKTQSRKTGKSSRETSMKLQIFVAGAISAISCCPAVFAQDAKAVEVGKVLDEETRVSQDRAFFRPRNRNHLTCLGLRRCSRASWPPAPSLERLPRPFWTSESRRLRPRRKRRQPRPSQRFP